MYNNMMKYYGNMILSDGYVLDKSSGIYIGFNITGGYYKDKNGNAIKDKYGKDGALSLEFYTEDEMMAAYGLDKYHKPVLLQSGYGYDNWEDKRKKWSQIGRNFHTPNIKAFTLSPKPHEFRNNSLVFYPTSPVMIMLLLIAVNTFEYLGDKVNTKEL